MLSRGVAGIRGASLIVNFPGSPHSIDQAGEAIAAALPHAVAADRRPGYAALAWDVLAARPVTGS